MAERDRPYQQLQVTAQPRYEGGVRPAIFQQKGAGGGPSAGQILAIVMFLPIGASLLGLAGVTMVGTLIGLAVATPLFVIFSPVLVPAAILLAGAVAGILTSGAFGLTGLSSFSWVVNSFRRATGEDPLEYARRRAQEATVTVGEKTKQMGEMMGEKTKQAGETIKSKAQEGGGGGVRT
ncbi:oleosin H1-like [Andrographis paniculata]|uniref:oleosin H1-like n=1 Tax=Andrographis paniculata TaxID=175694 RepID=UPI0021E96905|nr:oleosin H1-like [Andrographis paniculata]